MKYLNETTNQRLRRERSRRKLIKNIKEGTYVVIFIVAVMAISGLAPPIHSI